MLGHCGSHHRNCGNHSCCITHREAFNAHYLLITLKLLFRSDNKTERGKNLGCGPSTDCTELTPRFLPFAGPAGIPGIPGTPGIVGPVGPMGVRGIDGHKGSKGSKGSRGAHGLKGKRGAKGDAAAPSPALQVTKVAWSVQRCETTSTMKIDALSKDKLRLHGQTFNFLPGLPNIPVSYLSTMIISFGSNIRPQQCRGSFAQHSEHRAKSRVHACSHRHGLLHRSR